jgi:hypothetical protein
MAAIFPPENLDTDGEINYLANIRTTARRIFVGRLFKDRRKRQEPLPDGMEGRRWDDVNKKLDNIEKTTSKSGNILKSIVSIFKVAGEEAKRH